MSSTPTGMPQTLELGLAPDSEGPLGHAARLWDSYAALEPGQLVLESDATDFEELLRGKTSSPVAAAVAGLVLLRTRQLGRLHDWLENLSRWFDHLPDGSVLRAQQLRVSRSWEGEPVPIVEQLLLLRRRGLPFLAGVFEYAHELTNELMEHVYAKDLRRGDERGRRARDMRQLQRKLSKAALYARPGGMFQVYAAPPGTLGKKLVRP
jgi:hypothetical protein